MPLAQIRVRRTMVGVHVVHVIARLNNGGPVRVLAALGDMLRPQGIRFTVLAGRTAKDEADATSLLTAQGIEVIPVPQLGRAIAPLQDLVSLSIVRRHLQRLHPDLVHTHTAKAGFIGRLAAVSLGLSCLHTYHGHVLHGYFSRPKECLFRVLETIGAWTGHCHALTPCLQEELAYRYGLGLPWRWTTLPIPVASVQTHRAAWQERLTPGRPVIGFLGRLATVKDPDLFFRVVDLVNRQYPVQALICGDGELGPVVRAKAAMMSFPCHCTGFVPAGEALGAMDLLLMTSHNEGLPVGAVEALGAGIPCVAPAVGGLQDLGTGILVVPRRAKALAQAILRLLPVGAERQAWIDRGRRLADSLTPERLTSPWTRLYKRLARKPHAPA